MSAQSNLVITTKKSTTWYMLWGISLALLVILAFFFGVQNGKLHTDSLNKELAEKTDRLEKQDSLIEELEAELSDYKSRVGILEAADRLAHTSQIKSTETIKTLQEKIGELEKELSFFKNIMTPEDDKQGLQIEKFVAEKTAGGEEFQFRLSLTQTKKHNAYISGSVEVELIGSNNGEPTELKLATIAEEPKNWNFKFKYLQHIKGRFTLPPELTVSMVRVTAKVRSRKSITVMKEFRWQPTGRVVNVDGQKEQK